MSRRKSKKAAICPVSNKIRFRDHEEAVRALKKAKNTRWEVENSPGATTRNNTTRCYECQGCGGWHLTSKPEGYKPDLHTWRTPTPASVLAQIRAVANAPKAAAGE